MENFYSVLGIPKDAVQQDIKKAFREKAKKIHPDLASPEQKDSHFLMARLLNAYEVLSDPERRVEYDRAYRRFIKAYTFDYREFLRERRDDPKSQAKLIFFDLLHREEAEALALWDAQGGLDFRLEKYLDREDWMDCAFMLSEELYKGRRYFEAFMLLTSLIREERRKPYFRHFMIEIEVFLKELVRIKLRAAVDSETFAACIETLLELGFSRRDEAMWRRYLARAAEPVEMDND